MNLFKVNSVDANCTVSAWWCELHRQWPCLFQQVVHSFQQCTSLCKFILYVHPFFSNSVHFLKFSSWTVEVLLLIWISLLSHRLSGWIASSPTLSVWFFHTDLCVLLCVGNVLHTKKNWIVWTIGAWQYFDQFTTLAVVCKTAWWNAVHLSQIRNYEVYMINIERFSLISV